MIRFATIVFLSGMLVSPGMAQTPESTTFELNGTWVGWGWLGEAGDLPMRVHLAATEAGLDASYDSPAHRAFDVPFDGVEWKRPELRLEGNSPGGSPISVEGTLSGNSIRGTFRWANYVGTIELTRSPRPLTNPSQEALEHVPGFYERSPGDLVEISSRPWGELLYRELRTGRVRTLLPCGPDQFFIGSGIYLPHPVEATIQLVRDQQGSVTAIEEVRPGKQSRSAHRIGLVSESVTFRSGDAPLSGTLLKRADTRRPPAIVMMGGSSWETRDDVSFHARALAALGFAVLSYDRRGHGESGGESIVPFATTASDGVAAAAMLAGRSDVDSQRIGAFGMSRGGWYAPLAASMSERISFLILLVPPAVTPAAQETRSRLDQMQRDGFERPDLELATELLEAAWTWIRERENWDSYSALRSEAVSRDFPDYVLPPESSAEEEWRWSRMNMFFDPCPVLAQLRIPVLAIFGGSDIYVSHEINRMRLRECIGDDAALTARTIEGAGHDLAVANDLPVHRQAGRGDEGFSIIADWALEHVVNRSAESDAHLKAPPQRTTARAPTRSR